MLQHILYLLIFGHQLPTFHNSQLLWAILASSPPCLSGLVLTGVCYVCSGGDGGDGGQGHNFTFCYSSFPRPVSSYSFTPSSALQLFIKTQARLDEDSSAVRFHLRIWPGGHRRTLGPSYYTGLLHRVLRDKYGIILIIFCKEKGIPILTPEALLECWSC